MLTTLKNIMLIITAIGIVVGVAFFVINSSNFEKCKQIELELERIIHLNYTLEQENQRLRTKIHAFKFYRPYTEKVVRDELGLIRDGELIYVFPSEQKDM